MSADFALKLTNIESGAQLTNSTRIFTALNGVTAATPEGSDSITFLDGTDSALKKVTLTNFFDFLDDTFVRRTGTQSISDTKTFSSVVLTSADINGGTIDGTTINLGTNTLVGQLPVASGGTGLASYSVGSVLYASGSTTLSGLTAVATGNVLISGGLTTAPSWGKVGLTTHVSGTLAVGNGGTGASTLAAGVVKSNGTVLSSSAVGLTTEVTGVLPIANGGTGASTLSSGVVKSNGTVLSSSAVGLTTEVTGVLPIANGGTSYSQHPYGQISKQGAGELITGAGITDFSKLVIVTTLGAANLFDAGSPSGNNVLRYTGTQTRRFLIFASTDIMSGTLGDTFAIKLRKNTTLIDETECQARTAGKTSNYLAKLVTNWIVELTPNDYLELWVAAPVGDSGTPQRMRLIATPV
jgi:hypothetical protein